MTGWVIAHLMTLAAWGGLVLGEFALELAGRRDDALKPAVARLHRAIDIFVELPLLGAVFMTGSVLLLRTPLDAWLLVKVALGLTALAANSICFLWVLRRSAAARVAAPTSVLDGLTLRIYGTVVVGVPSALGALLMGARRAGWL